LALGRKTPARLAGGVLFTIMVIVRCDRSFGTEAPVNHLGWGFFLTHDKLFLV
jgi:hypothetical protein